MKNQSIVFAIWKDNTLIGFRSDTFNTITDNQPKIYTYSKEQIDTVLEGIKQTLNRVGTSFAKIIKESGIETNVEGDLIKHISEHERNLIELKEFEVRVHPFIDKEDIWTNPEQWKIDSEIANLKEAIEVHKFKVLDFSN